MISAVEWPLQRADSMPAGWNPGPISIPHQVPVEERDSAVFLVDTHGMNRSPGPEFCPSRRFRVLHFAP